MSGAAASPDPGRDDVAGLPPGDVVAAVRLMYLGAALTALLGVLRLLDPDEFRDAVADSSGDEFGRMSSDGQLAGYVLFAFVVAGVWLFVAWGSRRGRRRYRRIGTLFGALYVVGTVAALFQVDLNASTVVSVLMAAVAVAVLWLLYRPASNRYFAGHHQARSRQRTARDLD